MNVYSKHKNSRLQKGLIGAAVLALFIIPLVVFESPIKNIFYYFASPVIEASWTAGASSSGFLTPLFEWKSLGSRSDQLEKENQTLIARVAWLQDSLKESQRSQEAKQ